MSEGRSRRTVTDRVRDAVQHKRSLRRWQQVRQSKEAAGTRTLRLRRLSNNAAIRTRRFSKSKNNAATRMLRDRKLRSSQDRSSNSESRLDNSNALSAHKRRELNVPHGLRRSRLKANVLVVQQSAHNHSSNALRDRSNRNSKDHLPTNQAVVAVKVQAAEVVARVRARSLNF